MISLEELTPQTVKNMPQSKLPGLAASIRNFIINATAATGGHIGANLGTVELTIALHYVFSSPEDAFLWDTGHQGYTHKIITGRAAQFPTLNTYGGMNRFVSCDESEHDIMEASHAGTSLSMGLGIALAKRIKGQQGWAVPVIGDGALCEGLAFEALNHISAEPDAKVALVLNDNGYAISPGFGALHNYLQSRPLGTGTQETLFTSLGYETIGPVDGHNIDALIEAFTQVRESGNTTLVHVKTCKGYGYAPADNHPVRMHFSFPFQLETGTLKEPPATGSYQDVAAQAVGEIMDRDNNVAVITPSTLYATGLTPVFERHPARCFDPGMEEQHAMTMAAGLAKAGVKPVVFYQSTFMQRAFDQLFHDICFADLPIMMLAVRSGFAGYDNPTHHGIYDLSYLQCLPNLRILYPKDGFELRAMVLQQMEKLCGPVLILMPYGPLDELDAAVLDEPEDQLLKPQVVLQGKDILLLTVGNKFVEAQKAAAQLKEAGIDAGLVNIRQVKPLEEEALIPLLSSYERIVTIEEGVLTGGFGASVAALLQDRNIKAELLRIGLPCIFAEPGSNQELCEKYDLNSQGIVKRIKQRWS
ncbi:1-deoxy-D-xylulose-5-phosphate synthase [Oleidesulfovibrio sp.]|uniref:1-deoxy-D-xylulose-5-phosphate synthase n=1 Tax=Oleidesulfovibrio sp. TaxID=2909707 RepID=UPI003A8383A6